MDGMNNSASVSRPAYRTFRRRLLAPLARLVINPALGRLAGRRLVPWLGVLRHRGRRSGRDYATPVAVLRLGESFVLPLAFGEEADWVRNLMAAGSCTLRWRGADWSLERPAFLGWEDGSRALNRIERFFIPVFGVRRFVRLLPA
jgi:deazaflavin-dependent oxidoreductase (nitroreductase family)